MAIPLYDMTKVHEPYVLYEDESHKFIWLGLDESEYEHGILTNQYMIVHNGKAILLDPGGYFVFERVYNNVTSFVKPDDIAAIFYTHQDPDVIGSLTLWMDVAPHVKVYVSALWERFLPHLGIAGVEEKKIFIEIPDQGMEIDLNGVRLKAIPAHFLHSPGNFHLYDPVSKVYFSGDVGAAVYPPGKWYLFVENFEEHVKYMEGFHRRYLASSIALKKWLNRIRNLEINIIAPQHGAIFTEHNVKKFLDWLGSLDKVGAELMDY